MLFITSLPKQVLDTAMKEHSVNNKTEIVTQAWKNFQKEIKKEEKKKEYEAIGMDAEAEYDKTVSSVNSSRKSNNLDKIKQILS